MRIVLITPYDDWALGIRSIAAVLRARGHEVHRIFLKSLFELWRYAEIMEAEGAEPVGEGGFCAVPCRVTARETDLLMEKIGALGAQIVGISLSSNLAHLGEFLTRRIHKDLGIPVVWGGIEPTLHPDRAIETADYVCTGEGELPMADLVAALEKGECYPAIEGLWTRRADGAIHRSPFRPLIEDLDVLPYSDWDPSVESFLFGDRLENGFLPPAHTRVHLEVPVMTQRGCPFACSYCCYAVVKKRYPEQKFVRRRSVGHVIGELIQLRRRFPTLQEFWFYDDVFTLDPVWVEEFAERYAQAIALPFSCYTHPNSCTRRMIEPLKRAGLVELTMGIQSGSERVLYECYNRRTPREKILEAARLIHDLGIALAVDLIGFNPMETEEDRRASFDLLLELPRPFRVNMVNALSFYEGLPVTEKALREGVKLTRSADVRGKYEQEITSDMHFWAALMGLTMFDLDPQKVLLLMIADPWLRQHPEILEQLRLALFQMNFSDGQIARMPKDALIDSLRTQLGWYQARAARPLFRKVLDGLLGR